jgi:signal peptidase II
MAEMRRGHPATAALTALTVLALDQASKIWVLSWLAPGREVIVIPGWAWFRVARNTGATLGLLGGHNALFIGLSVVVVAAVIAILIRGPIDSALGAIALGMVSGGALSNVIDRVRLGAVVDFIEVHLWPTDFNLADVAIRLGVILLLLALLLDLRRGRRPRSLPA